jgi:hypothetical protein
MRVVAIVLLVLGLAAPRAFANAKAEAKKKIELAGEHHAAGRFKEALEQLTVAYTLHPQPDLLYAIAQVHVKLGDCASAITFYERFLSTRPPSEPADAAREAIEVCKTAPPPAEPAPVPAALEPAPIAPAPVAPPSDEPRAWYKDPLGLGLVGGGLACGVIGLITYRSATGDLDAADDAATYPEHDELVDKARGKRTLAAVFAIGGVALVGAGTIRFVMVRKRESNAVAIVPTAHGGFVTWSGSW